MNQTKCTRIVPDQHRMLSLCLAAMLLPVVSGCQKTYDTPKAFLPNTVFKMAIFRQSPEEYEPEQIDTAFEETTQMVEKLFGTLGNEKFPTSTDLFASEEETADYDEFTFAGAAERNHLAKGGELYRQHCVICHGITGDGRGRSSSNSNPYPRDYRAGLFKYKSTVKGQKPLITDLQRVIKHGIPGTTMVKITELTEDADIEAIADYVVYLSARGQVEREILKTAAFDLDLYEEHILPSANDDEEVRADLAGLVDEVITDVFYSWDEAESEVESLEPPEAFADRSSDQWKQMVAAGQDVYKSKTGACFTCHDKAGDGPAREPMYDEWTKEWTTAIQIDPTDYPAQVPFIARGAMPPKELVARQFGSEPLHDGDDPRRMFLKIAYGIEGTPMPKATINAEEIWSAIAYVLEETEQGLKKQESPAVDPAMELSSK